MKPTAVTLFLCFVYSFATGQDSLRRPRRVHPLVFSSVSYQLAVNGNNVDTDLGNFAFKGYVQPEIGIGLRYQQDTMEFATVGLSATRFVFTLASSNVIYDNGTEYPITNRVDLYMNNYALTTAYHRRLTKKNPNHFLSLECGVGLHLIQWYGTVRTDDDVVGPYTSVHSVNTPKKLYALPSATGGLTWSLVSAEHKTNFLFGLQGELYLDNFQKINYSVSYSTPNNTLNYHFNYAPVILAPKVYVMAMF